MKFLAGIFSLGLMMSTHAFADLEEEVTLSCARLNDDGSIFPSKFNAAQIVINNQTGKSKMLVSNTLIISLGRVVELPLIYAGFSMADSSNENLGKAFYLAASTDPEQENMMAELTLNGSTFFDQPTDGTLQFGQVIGINPLVMGKHAIISKVRCYAN